MIMSEVQKRYSGIGVSCNIVEELFCFLHSACSALGLLNCNQAQCHKDGDIEGTCIVQYTLDDTLDFFDLFRGQFGRDVNGEGGLGFCAVLFWCRSVGVMLWF
jgi:hypothetical protein